MFEIFVDFDSLTRLVRNKQITRLFDLLKMEIDFSFVKFSNTELLSVRMDRYLFTIYNYSDLVFF